MLLYGKWIVVENEDFTEEEVDFVKQQIAANNPSKLRILISREMALRKGDFFERISKVFPGIDVFIKVEEVEYDPNFNQSQVFTRDEMLTLFEHNNELSKTGAKLFLSAHTFTDDPLDRENKIPFSKVIQSNARMNNWVDKINKARVNGKPLSPFEKYLYAYQIVTQFKYTSEQIFEARDISRVLSGKFIVCAGYSAILSELCRRVGIVCKKQFIHVHETGNPNLDRPGVANHEECMFYLKDTKYGIDGFFLTDPTLDSLDQSVEAGTSLTHALINLDEHDKLYNNSEALMISDYADFSTFFFLRDAKMVPNIKLFYESESYLEDVAEALDASKFDDGFTSFLTRSINEMTVPKRINNFVSYNGSKYENIMLNGEAYTIDQVAKDFDLMTNLAYKYYAIGSYSGNPDSVVVKQFFEKVLATYLKNSKTQKTPEFASQITAGFIKNAKETESVIGDPQLLSAIADLHDISVIIETKTYQKLNEIMNSHAIKTPTLEDYRNAMRVVYMARGDKPEEAKAEADYLVNVSVWVADAKGWANSGTQNPFAVEAAKTRPVEAVQNKQLEVLAPYIEQVGLTVDYVKNVLDSKDEEEIARIVSLIESVMPEKEEPEAPKKKYDNRTIKTWNSAPKTPRFWDSEEIEKINVEHNPFDE